MKQNKKHYNQSQTNINTEKKPLNTVNLAGKQTKTHQNTKKQENFEKSPNIQKKTTIPFNTKQMKPHQIHEKYARKHEITQKTT